MCRLIEDSCLNLNDPEREFLKFMLGVDKL